MKLKDYNFFDWIDCIIRFFLYILIFWLPYGIAVIESCVVFCLLLWIVKRGAGIIFLFNQKKKDALGGHDKLDASGHASVWDKYLCVLKGFKPKESFIDKPIVFFLIACMLSIINSVFYKIALHGFLSKTLEWLVVYYLILEVFHSRWHIYVVIVLLMITSSSVAIDGILQYHITKSDIFFGHVMGPDTRATASFKTPNSLGAYIAMVIPLFLSIGFLVRRNIYKIGIAIFSVFLFWSLIVTFSRGAWFSLFYVLLLMFFIAFIDKIFLKSKDKVIFFVAFFCFCVFSLLILKGNVVSSWLDRQGNVVTRVSIWTKSFEMMAHRPFFGHGVNTFMRIFQGYRNIPSNNPTYAHNCYIQLACEIGFLGLISFLWVMERLFYEFHKKKYLLKRNIDNFALVCFGLLSSISIFLVHSIFDTQLYSVQLSIFFWYIIGLYVVSNRIMARNLCK